LPEPVLADERDGLAGSISKKRSLKIGEPSR